MENPIVTIIKNNEILEFKLQDVNVSIANSIRRILLSEIPVVAIITLKNSENQCAITKNTSRFTNEIIKQRISCIPIHIKPNSINLDELIITCSKKNNTEEIMYVTSQDLNIIDKNTNNPISKADRDKIFPPDPYTNQYIDIIRLKPSMSSNLDGEEIEFQCTMTVSNAKYNNSFNAVSKATYGNTLDPDAAAAAWDEYSKQLKDVDLEYERKNWYMLEAKRYFIPNSFNFKVETVGIYKNKELVKIACDIMLLKLATLKESLEKSTIDISKSASTIKNCFDITLKNEDYTLGKSLEYALYALYFEGNKTLSYIGFTKMHPHDTDSIIRLALKEIDDTKEHLVLFEYLTGAITLCNTIFNSIKNQI